MHASIESNQTGTKNRLGTIPRQASVAPAPEAPAPIVHGNRTKRVCQAIIGLCATGTVVALAAAAATGVGATPTIGAYGSMASPVAEARQAGFPSYSGDLRLDGVYVRPDGFTGTFSGVAKLTWTGAAAIEGKQNVSVSVQRHGREVATMQGSIVNVAAGGVATVNLTSNDRFASGPLTFVLGTGVATLTAEGTLNQLNGLSMLADMRATSIQQAGSAPFLAARPTVDVQDKRNIFMTGNGLAAN
ncbi:MAG: hypothetical protein ACT4QG_18070 [Sporichthyaceae bacterium]